MRSPAQSSSTDLGIVRVDVLSRATARVGARPAHQRLCAASWGAVSVENIGGETAEGDVAVAPGAHADGTCAVIVVDVGQDGAGILAGEAAGAARGVPHAAVGRSRVGEALLFRRCCFGVSVRTCVIAAPS